MLNNTFARKIYAPYSLISQRDKHSFLWDKALFVFSLFFVTIFTFIFAKYIMNDNWILSGILLLLFLLEGIFLLSRFQRQLLINVNSLKIFPLSSKRLFAYIMYLIIIDKRNLLWLIAIPIIGINIYIGYGVSILSLFIIFAFLNILCVQIWYSVALFIIELSPDNKKKYSGILFQTLFLFIIIPNIFKIKYIYNYYPFGGWIGSIVNFSNNQDYVNVVFYFILVFTLILIGLWNGNNLALPGKKVRQG